MGERSELLAGRILEGANKLIAEIENLTIDEWGLIAPNEKRSIGVLAHHVASSYQVEIDLAFNLANGEAITGITSEMIDSINSDHAEEYSKVKKENVIDLLKNNSRKAADRVRALTNAQLDKSAEVSLNANAPLTTQFFIEDHALKHSFQHLESIKNTLNK